MRLAGEDELDRALAVIENSAQTLEVAEEQRSAFVSGEAAREPNGEDLRIAQARDVPDRLGTFAKTRAVSAQAVADEVEQPVLEREVSGPDGFIGNIHHLAPEVGIREVVFPAR